MLQLLELEHVTQYKCYFQNIIIEVNKIEWLQQ
jgi:hypothetical protein